VKIVLICHYFAPEPGAPQARLRETARTWAAEGHDVTVITGFPNHPTGVLAPEDRGRVYREDRMDGFRVKRCYSYATPNRGFLKKTLGHLSFMVTAVLLGGFRTARPDVLVVSSPTFFSVLSALVLSALWRRPFVFEVRDLWPAIFTELGVITDPRIIRPLEALEMFLYGRACRVVTVTEGFRENIVGRTGRYRPGGNPLAAKEELGLAGLFVVLYLGAHGISHALSRVLDVAERRRSDARMRFVFVGDGAEKRALTARARAAGLENVEFRPPVPKDEVADHYRAADVCLVPLRDVPLFRTFIPSKLFEILGAGVPVVASLAGESAAILKRSGGAIVVPPEDVAGIDDALARLRDDPTLREEMGRAGRRFVTEHYDRADLARRYLAVLSEAVLESR